MKTAGRIAKWTVIFIIYFLIALVIFRCCFAAERSTLSDITPTDALRAAYRADPSLELQTHKIVAEIAQERSGTLKVGKVNVDEAPDLAAKYGINSIPALFLFKGGNVAAKTVGYQDKAALERFVSQ